MFMPRDFSHPCVVAVMKNFNKSLSRAIAWFIAGVVAWLFLASLAEQSILTLPPVAWVMVMGLCIMSFAAVALWVHMHSVAGLPLVDKRQRRRPSFIIPVISTIVFMVFVVGSSGGNPAIWTMG